LGPRLPQIVPHGSDRRGRPQDREEERDDVKYGVLDIENVGEPWEGKLICLGWRDRAYLPFEVEHNRDGVRDELADESIAKVVFTKHDHRYLRLAGYDVRGPIVDVQAMAWAVDENTDLDLATCSRLYGDGEVKDPRITQRGGVPVFKRDDGTVEPLENALHDEAMLAEVQAYNEQDLVSTEATYHGLLRRLHFEGEGLADYWERYVLPFSAVLLDMECRGIPVDVEAARSLRLRLEGEIAELERALHDTAKLPDDFNLASSAQLGLFLFSRRFDHKRRLPITKGQRATLLGREVKGVEPEPIDLPPDFTVTNVGTQYVTGVQSLVGKGFKVHARTDKGKPSTDAKTLKVHFGDDEWVADYLALAKRRTIVNTFLTNIEELAHNGRLYGQFVQTGTATGRLSSRNPNLQNQPSRGELGAAVRSLFRPTPGNVFIHGDYSQLEPRIMAHFSGDPVLTDIFLNGDDVYLRTAEEVFGECGLRKDDPRRSMMKVYVLALGYGAWPKTLRQQLAVEGYYLPLHEVEETFERLRAVYSVLFDWREHVIDDARTVGYVDTLSGHRRRIRFGKAQSWRDAAAGREGRQAANARVQGSAADIVQGAMEAIEREFCGDPRILVQVHDELLMEARHGVERRHPDLLGRIEQIATTGHGFDLSIPLVFEPRFVRTWKEGKD
jgi:DNA polymerase I-like protein with 3'-5' exonuclease and polymerase domains